MPENGLFVPGHPWNQIFRQQYQTHGENREMGVNRLYSEKKIPPPSKRITNGIPHNVSASVAIQLSNVSYILMELSVTFSFQNLPVLYLIKGRPTHLYCRIKHHRRKVKIG